VKHMLRMILEYSYTVHQICRGLLGTMVFCSSDDQIAG
jgi:hypothetical protein